jgi:hypothetical protein
MYAVMDVWRANLRPGLDRDTVSLAVARSIDPLGWVAVEIHDCTNDPAASFPAMSFGRDYQVRAVPEGLRLRAAAVGLRAEQALMRAFDDDTRIEVAIPTFKNPRRMRELTTALNRGAAEYKIDQLGGRLFRSLFPTRVTDVRLSRTLRENLPRVYPQSHSPISGSPYKYQEISKCLLSPTSQKHPRPTSLR